MISLVSLLPKVESTLHDAMVKIAKESVQRIRDSLSTQGNYRTHSSPGEPPFRQTGDLQGSVGYQIDRNDISIKATAGHAPYMEFGTRTVAPRPFMRPEMKRLQDGVMQDVADYFEAHFRV